MSQQGRLTIVMQASKKTNNTTHLRVNKMQLQDFATLAEAQAHEVVTPRLIHRDTFNGILSLAGVYSAMKKIAATEGHPAQNQMDAFMDSVEYNFMDGEPTSTGEIQKAALDSLIAANISIDMAGVPVAVSTILGAVKPVILARANPVSKPFAKLTAHDFAVAKDAPLFPAVTPTISESHAIITVSSDCESHRPRLLATNDRTQQLVAVRLFPEVSKAGIYECRIPDQWLSKAIFVDNNYGVFS